MLKSITRTPRRRLFDVCIYICKTCFFRVDFFLEILIVDLDFFKMFMIYNVCKTDILKTPVRCLYTPDAFQIKRSLTDILQTYMCYVITILAYVVCCKLCLVDSDWLSMFSTFISWKVIALKAINDIVPLCRYRCSCWVDCAVQENENNHNFIVIALFERVFK